VNFEIIKSNPKWYQGYSDNTHVTFSVTTKTDIATIYGDNFGSYGMSDWHEAVRNNMDIVTGKNIVQNSFKYCHDTFHKYETGYESFFEDKEVYYKGFKNGSEVDELTLRGRIIGGCTDVIYDMAGTTYEDFKGFALRHKEEGILLYLESFVANSETTVRELWKFREMGWFEHVNGILFGRPTFEGSDYGVSYEEAVKTVLGPLGIPYVTGCDIGHKSPQFTIVNGAMAEFRLKDHKGSIRFDYI